MIFANVGLCLFGAISLAWWILGIVWRFSPIGMYSSGDVVPEGVTVAAWAKQVRARDSIFQFSSGRFMFVFYVITWSLLAGTLIGVIAAVLVNCCENSFKREGHADKREGNVNRRRDNLQIPVGAINA